MSRKQEFLETGAKLAVKVGIVNVTRRAIASHHKVTDPLVSKYVGGKDEMRKAIKSTMKKLGLKEPAADVAEAKGKALRARKPVAKKAVKKVVAKKSTSARSAAARAKATGTPGKKVAAKKSAAKKSTGRTTAKSAAAGNTRRQSTTATSKTAVAKKTEPKRLPTGVDPKKGAPQNKQRGKFKTKEAPPLPPLPTLTPTV